VQCFLLAYIGKIPVSGHSRLRYVITDDDDLIIPRILAGEEITRQDINQSGAWGPVRLTVKSAGILIADLAREPETGWVVNNGCPLCAAPSCASREVLQRFSLPLCGVLPESIRPVWQTNVQRATAAARADAAAYNGCAVMDMRRWFLRTPGIETAIGMAALNSALDITPIENRLRECKCL